MKDFTAKDYKAFEMFDKQWAIVTAGSIKRYNSCTVSWGSLGNIWGHAGKSLPVVTVYIHPARYTSEFLKDNDTFTVSFYPENCKEALGYIGSHSGRDGDKTVGAGLTPVEIGQSVTYKEANLTFLCKNYIGISFLKTTSPLKFRNITPLCPKHFPTLKVGGNRTSFLSAKSLTLLTNVESEFVCCHLTHNDNFKVLYSILLRDIG